MTPQELQALQNFLMQLVQARGGAKDPQADSLIAGAVAQQPDAPYLLVQRVLMVEQALERAKTQIASLQGQLQAAQSAPARAFLDAEAWGNTPVAPARPAVSAPMAPTLMQPQFAAMPPQAPPASSGFFSGGLGGTLGTVAATAAGVAGGALLFQGIEHMMHPGGAAGFLHPSGQAPFAPPAENTTVNNNYGSEPAPDSASSLNDLAAEDTGWDDDLTSA